jgi:hypothetical protein
MLPTIAATFGSPPCLLRLPPRGAVAGWDLHPREKGRRRILTAGVRASHDRLILSSDEAVCSRVRALDPAAGRHPTKMTSIFRPAENGRQRLEANVECWEGRLGTHRPSV